MQIYIESLALILIFEFILFLIAVKFRRNDLADVGWGLGFGFVAIYSFYKNAHPDFFQKLLLILIICWSLRLAGYLGWRMKGKTEDQRYVDMRAKWKTNWIIKTLLSVFVLQGILLWILAGPAIYHLSTANLNLNDLTWIPISLCFVGLCYETIADLQKSAFKKLNSSPDVFISSGLFKYSRYPQYFGEIVFWFGVALFQFKPDKSLLLIYAPFLLTLLLRFLSGVPLLEVKYMRRPGYKEYADKTPLMIPKLV